MNITHQEYNLAEMLAWVEHWSFRLESDVTHCGISICKLENIFLGIISVSQKRVQVRMRAKK